MRRAWRSVRIACPFCSPTGARDRPFCTLSRILSAFVPENKWSGLAQLGLSQVCRACIPTSKSPVCKAYEKRCARVNITPAKSPLKIPYPFLSLLAFHSQHPSVLATDFANRSSAERPRKDPLWDDTATGEPNFLFRRQCLLQRPKATTGKLHSFMQQMSVTTLLRLLSQSSVARPSYSTQETILAPDTAGHLGPDH